MTREARKGLGLVDIIVYSGSELSAQKHFALWANKSVKSYFLADKSTPSMVSGRRVGGGGGGKGCLVDVVVVLVCFFFFFSFFFVVVVVVVVIDFACFGVSVLMLLSLFGVGRRWGRN